MAKKLVSYIKELAGSDGWVAMSDDLKKAIGSVPPPLEQKAIELINSEIEAKNCKVDLWKTLDSLDSTETLNQVQTMSAPESKPTAETKPNETAKPAGIKGFFQGKWFKWISTAVLIITIVAVAIFWITGGPSSQPQISTISNTTQYVQPNVQPTQQLPDQTNVPDTNSSPGITFQMPNIDGLFGSSVKMQLHNAPKTYKDILGNWIVWLVLVFLVRLYLTTFRSETNDRKEPKDYNATMKGLYYFLILFILAVGITPILVGACSFFEKNCSASNLPLIIRIAGAALFIGTAIGAATGGNWDASPIAFAFLISGLTFKLGSAQGSDAGSILIIVGVGVQIYEMLRHENERYAAIFGTLLALVLALIVGGVTMIGINTLGIRYFPAIVPYQLVIGFVVATITAVGSSGSLVQKQVQGILPVGMREEVRDPGDSVYFDIKLFVLMIAIAIIVF